MTETAGTSPPTDDRESPREGSAAVDASHLRRRRLLTVLGTIGLGGVAGCIGDGSDGDGADDDGAGGDGGSEDDDVAASVAALSEEELWGQTHDVEVPSPGTGILELGGETFEFETMGCHAFSDRQLDHLPFRATTFGRGTWNDREFQVSASRTIMEGGNEDENLTMNVDWADPDEDGPGPTIGRGPSSELPERAQGDQPMLRVDRDEAVFTARTELEGLTMGADEVPGGEATLVVNCHSLFFEEDSLVWFDGQELEYVNPRTSDVERDEVGDAIGSVSCTKPPTPPEREHFEAVFDVGDDPWGLTVEYDHDAEVVERVKLSPHTRLGTFEATDPDELAAIEYVPTSHAKGSVSLAPADEHAEDAAPDGHEIEFELYCA